MEVTYRAYREQDQEAVLQLLENAHLAHGTLLYCMRHFPEYGLVAIREGSIIGCGFRSQANENGRAGCGVYVRPEERRKRIGTTLLWRLQEGMQGDGIQKMGCMYEEGSEGELFAQAKGMEPAHTVRYMSYEGEPLEIEKGDISGYQDHDYEEVRQLLSGAFGEVRQPSEEEKASYHARKQDIFVCREAGQIVAVASLQDNEIRRLAVRADRQGQGWGRAMISFSINELQKRGYEKCYLWVMVGNHAIRTYHNLKWVVEGTYIFASKSI